MARVHSQRLFPFPIVEVPSDYVGEEGGIPGYNAEDDYAFVIRPYPVGLTKHQLAALYWRPKNWGAEIDPPLSVTTTNSTATASAAIGARDWQSAPDAAGLNEKNLVLSPWAGTAEDSYAETVSDTQHLISVSMETLATVALRIGALIFCAHIVPAQGVYEPEIFENGLFPCVFSDGLYYPCIYIDLELDMDGTAFRGEAEGALSNGMHRSVLASTRHDHHAHRIAQHYESVSVDLPVRIHLPVSDSKIDVTFAIPGSLIETSGEDVNGPAGVITMSSLSSTITFRPWEYHTYDGDFDPDTGESLL